MPMQIASADAEQLQTANTRLSRQIEVHRNWPRFANRKYRETLVRRRL